LNKNNSTIGLIGNARYAREIASELNKNSRVISVYGDAGRDSNDGIIKKEDDDDDPKS